MNAKEYEVILETLSRRKFLKAGSAALALTALGGATALRAQDRAGTAAGVFGNPDLPPEGAVNVTNPKALTDPGPQDPGLAGYEPSFLTPPPRLMSTTVIPQWPKMALGRLN
jgi:hypothetical protein